MTAHIVAANASDALGVHDAVDVARTHIAARALRESTGGGVGLELEFHLVELARPWRRPRWSEVCALAAGLPPMPNGSSVTFEPGAQVELSTPPTDGVAASIVALQADCAVLRSALAAQGYGAAPLGTDPVRPVERVNPSARYVAMEQHFAAVGIGAAGRAMMSGTAALQVNVDAGPRAGWAGRVRRICDLVPVLVALSACSPYLAGRATGWHSMRQQIWHELAGGVHSAADDHSDPELAWADAALRAPIMLVRDGAGARPMTKRVPMQAWLTGVAPLARRPTVADVDYHLTTLFPPVRLRGYLELRCLDAMPDRWWPALAAITATLVDDDIAAARAAELCAPVRDAGHAAARDGLRDVSLRAAVLGCVEIAALRCPPPLKAEVHAYAELLEQGRTPGDDVRTTIAERGPLAALQEAADA